MKNTTVSFVFYLLLLSSNTTIAQTAYYNYLLNQWNSSYGISAGSWSIPADEQQVLDRMFSYGGTVSTFKTTGLPFEKALQMNIPTAGINAWDAAIFVTNSATIAKGDRLLVTMWVRSADTTAGFATLYSEHADTYDKEAYYTFSIPKNWTQYIFPIEAQTSYPINKLRFGFQVGTKQQKLEFGGFAVRNYSTLYPLSQFPTDLHQNYAGSEKNAPWRKEAAAGIENYRKANLSVFVKNAKGIPVPGAKVKVKMLQHQFKFGSAVNARQIFYKSAQNDIYQQKILDFDGKGHGFNEVVFENDLKWDAYEGQWAASNSELTGAVNWIKAHNLTIRGHNLVWPSWQYMPSDMKTNQNNITYLKNRIDGRINTMLTLPALKNSISEWDVLNEITDNNELANAFSGSTNYPTGREIYSEIMKKVKEIDPKMKTYLNDYVTIDQGNTSGNPKYERCKQYIDEIIKAGAVVDGIGFQAHIGAGLVSIYDVKKTLDDFQSAYRNRAKITEYDLSKLVNDSLAAQFTGDLLTMCFSHPYVDGFLSWGFWDGAHWLDNSPYFHKDWTMKPAAKRVSELLFNEWWTKDTILTTDHNGLASIRGFKGLYQISELCNTSKDTIELFGDIKLSITSKAPISEFSYKSFERDIWLSNFSVNADSTYWDFGDNTNSSQVSPQHKYLKDGSYLVRVRSFNQCGFSDTSQLIIIKTTSAADFSELLIQNLYPNPGTGDITLELMGSPKHHINLELLNSLSQSVYQSVEDFNTGYLKQHFDFGELGTGFYFLKLRNGEKMLTVPLLIK